MIQTTACPDASRWQALLADADASDSAELESHLSGCLRCQHVLDDLAVGSSGWLKDANRLATKNGDEMEMTRTLHRLRDEFPDDHAVPPIALDFLKHSDLPGVLGTLGRYQVLEVIGRGAFGIVLKALDPDLLRPVAIKVLAPYLAPSGTARQRFLREARAAAAVSHDHVVTIHAVEPADGLPYLVMEYITGVSLQGRLDRDGPLPPRDIARIGLQAANGLSAAHAMGLVHRDIKPANILLENGVERVKITDFGLARAADDARLTQSGVAAGTPLYMSPEQARGEAVDGRSDLFSLGSVLYTLATGFPPFRADSTMGVLNRITNHPPRPIRETIPDFPVELEKIIMQLLEKEPGKRFQLAADVSFRLGAFLSNPQAQPSPKADSDEEPPEHTNKWVVALCLIAAAAMVAIVLTFRTPKGTLIVEVDDPAIKVAIDGEELKITGAGPQEVRIKVGEHHVTATKDGKPAKVSEEIVTIAKDGRQVVKVTVVAEPARPAVDGKVLELDRMSEEMSRIVKWLALRGKMKPGELDAETAKLSALMLEASNADNPPEKAIQALTEAHKLALAIALKEGYPGLGSAVPPDKTNPTKMDPAWEAKLDDLMTSYKALVPRLADTAAGLLMVAPGPVADLEKAVASIKDSDRERVKRLLGHRDQFLLMLPRAQAFAIRLQTLKDLVASSARKNATEELEAIYGSLLSKLKDMEKIAVELGAKPAPAAPVAGDLAGPSVSWESRQKKQIADVQALFREVAKTHVGKAVATIAPGTDGSATFAKDLAAVDAARAKRLLALREQFGMMLPAARKELDRWEKASLEFTSLDGHYKAGTVSNREWEQAKLELKQAERAMQNSEEAMAGLLADMNKIAMELRVSADPVKGPGQ